MSFTTSERMIHNFHLITNLPDDSDDNVVRNCLFGPSTADELIDETQYHMAKLNDAMREVEASNSQAAKVEVERIASSIVHYMAKSVNRYGK